MTIHVKRRAACHGSQLVCASFYPAASDVLFVTGLQLNSAFRGPSVVKPLSDLHTRYSIVDPLAPHVLQLVTCCNRPANPA